MRPSCLSTRLAIGLLALLLSTATAAPEDSWNPFAESDNAPKKRVTTPAEPPRPLLAPMGANSEDGPSNAPAMGGSLYEPLSAGSAPSPFSARTNMVERADLSPVISNDGSGLPLELWNGLDLAAVESLLAKLDIPPRSPAVNALWRRLLLSESAPSSTELPKFQALRAEALLRSGLLPEQSDALAKAIGTGEAGSGNAVLLAMKVRSDIARGNRDAGCAAIKDAGNRKGDLPKRLAGDMIVLAGYCAAAAGNARAAGLAAELAREEGHDAGLAISALDAISLGPQGVAAAKITLPKRIDAVDWRLLTLAGPQNAAAILERADPSLLAVLASDAGGDPKLQLAATEAAARINVATPDRLAEVYRAQTFAAAELADPLVGRPDPLIRRALLFKSAEAERSPQNKARVLRALLDDAQRNSLYLPMLRATGKMIAAMPRAVEIGWFAETAIEAMLAAERYHDARTWATFAQGLDGPVGAAPSAAGLQHWLALIDIANSNDRARRGDSLASIEQMALAGRFTPELLHRLATVLDALDYQVPIPLWDAASKSPQPGTGHLPETGVLGELQDAAKKKEFGRTVLLTLRTLGANGAAGAHLIALGDAIRALKRAGLEPDARRLGFEALFAGWPRNASN